MAPPTELGCSFGVGAPIRGALSQTSAVLAQRPRVLPEARRGAGEEEEWCAHRARRSFRCRGGSFTLVVPLGQVTRCGNSGCRVRVGSGGGGLGRNGSLVVCASLPPFPAESGTDS